LPSYLTALSCLVLLEWAVSGVLSKTHRLSNIDNLRIAALRLALHNSPMTFSPTMP
jgi:hypothetical protein